MEIKEQGQLQFLKKAFNECLKDFNQRGVGYCILEGLEFNLVMYQDCSLMNFKVLDNLSDNYTIIDTFEPTQEQINTYKRNFQ